jgi:hypothetical protein
VTTPEMFIAGSPHTRLSPVPPAHHVLFQILLSEPMLRRQNGDGGDRLPPHQTAQALHRDVQELRRLFSVQEILMIHRQIIDDEIHANLDEGITNFEAGWIGVHKGFRGKPPHSLRKGTTQTRSGRPISGEIRATI